MNRRIKRIGLGFALIIFAAANASAQIAVKQSEFDHDGRRYEIYKFMDGPKDWETARTFTEDLDFMTVQGTLATITSMAEDEAIRLHVLDQNTNNSAGLRELWVGGYQEPGSVEPDEGWMWLNGEAIPATNAGPGYANWESGEPNDLGGEDHLAIGLGGKYGPGYGWNDEQALGNIDGFVVEYGDIVEVIPADCLSPEGCAPLPEGAAQHMWPAGTVVTGDPVQVRTFEFIDELHNQVGSRCGIESRTLFGPGATPPLDDYAPVVVPAWLCGSPRFLIVHMATEGIVEIPSGTVTIENEPLAALEDNLYECELAIGDQDLRHRDVVGWQTTALDEMVEARFRADNPDLFDVGGKFEGLGDTMGSLGTMGEFTDGCSSSRGRVRGSSYHAIGLHIHPADTSDANLDFTVVKFIELIEYKLALLQYSVIESKDVLDKNGYKKLKKRVKQAIKQVGKGNFNSARSHMLNFMRAVDQATYDLGSGNNENGEHLSRGANIIHHLETSTALP